ncbi:hypothetical protein BMETH_669_0 [methanotrophic bacterial endosymbiont of Bathymodiolus sp.]|nr:hypothetical protein BMETH_669_0 [methanotrophic bacterial endosymbiont of Bathymodiolus sp.]
MIFSYLQNSHQIGHLLNIVVFCIGLSSTANILAWGD